LTGKRTSRGWAKALIVAGILIAAAYLGLVLGVPESGDFIPATGNRIAPERSQFRVACISDCSGTTTALRKICAEANSAGVDFSCLPGDLTQARGRSEVYYIGKVIGDSLRNPYYTVPGNHDAGHPADLETYCSVFGPDHYWFGYGDTLFICLNTAMGCSDATYRYLHDTLEARRSDYRRCVIFCHIFPAPEYRYGAPEENDTEPFRKAIGTHKIDLLVVGHLHRFMETSFGGVRSVVLPSSGQDILDRNDPNYGFVLLDFNADGSIGVRHVDVTDSTGTNHWEYFLYVVARHPAWFWGGLGLSAVGCLLLWFLRRKREEL